MNIQRVESAEKIRAILTDPEWRVRAPGNEVPAGLQDSMAGRIFASFARMTDGPDHLRRRALGTELIDSFDLNAISTITDDVFDALKPATPGDIQFLAPGLVVAGLLGVQKSHRQELVEQIRALVVGARPAANDSECAAAIEAMERAVPTIAGSLDPGEQDDLEHIASRISLVFQASDACAAMIGNALLMLAEATDPAPSDAAPLVRDSMRARVPVRTTSRFRDTETAVLDLESAHQQYPNANWTFGFGPHACPGRSIAVAIANACIEAVIENRPFDFSAVRNSGWEGLPNVWIPVLTLQQESAR